MYTLAKLAITAFISKDQSNVSGKVEGIRESLLIYNS